MRGCARNSDANAVTPSPLLDVVGSGPVAAAFALFALRQGFAADEIALNRHHGPTPPGLTGRVLALSLGTSQLLGRIAAPPRAAPILTVDVSVLGHLGRTRLRASELGVAALGHVLRYPDLMRVLDDALDRHFPSARIDQERSAPGSDERDAEGGGDCGMSIVVHAEGDTGPAASERHFDQAALLAEVGIEREHGAVAFECFTAHGPLALLPLPESHRCSLVWCDRPDESARRAALSPAALADELQQTFGGSLGRLTIESPVVCWSMIRRARRALDAGREVWIGNAAQGLHPVAGQGLNLGLRDAFVLAQKLGDARARGDLLTEALPAYVQARAADRDATIGLTDLLARAFAFSALHPLQSITLGMLDAAAPLRAAVAHRFMYGRR